MGRYQFLLIVLGVLLCSCSETSQKTDKTTATIETKKSIVIVGNPSSEKFYTVDREYYHREDYSLIVKSIYLLTDTLKYDSSYYCRGNYLFIISQTNNSTDSIELAEGCVDGVLIQDVTQMLQFHNPIFNIASPSGSDKYINEFFEYKNGSLKKLFEIFELIKLERKDQHALSGYVKDRDEIVSASQDYPVVVSLDDYSVHVERPTKQEIGYKTVVVSDFEGYKINENLKTRYLVKKGTTVLIDSINRKTNIVRLMINDTIVIYVPVLQIKDKVQGNDAG